MRLSAQSADARVYLAPYEDPSEKRMHVEESHRAAHGPGNVRAADLPRARASDGVECALDHAQHYALYLRSKYTPSRQWRVIEMCLLQSP